MNIQGEVPPNPEFIYKILCIYSYTFKLQSPSKYSPPVAVHLSRCFFHVSEQCLNSSILMPFCAFAFFLFYLFHISNTVLFEDFFHSGKQKMLLGGDQVNMEGGAQESCCFLVKKLLNTQCSVGRCTCKSPIVKWENVLSLQTKFIEAKCSLSQQHQLVH